MRYRLIFLLAILILLCNEVLVSDLCRGTRFYKRTNSKHKTLQINKLLCAAACGKDPECKGYSMRREVHQQYVTHGDEIFNISDSISTDLWMRECPKGFFNNIYQSQCYLFVEDLFTWYEALSFCENKSAYLAELIDTEERDAVWNYAKGLKITSQLWVGITQRDLHQTGYRRDYQFYKSAIEIPNTAAYWANRFLPDPLHPVACASVRPIDDDSRFHDARCTLRSAFLCER